MNEDKYIESSNNFKVNEEGQETQNNLQSQGNTEHNYDDPSEGSMKRNTKVLLIVIALILVIVAIVVPVTITQAGGNDDDEDNQVGICEEDPSSCEGTTPEMQDFINGFSDPAEAQTALTFFKTMSKINLEDPENYSENFKQMMRVSECMKSAMPNKSGEAYGLLIQNQFNTEESALAYLSMVGNFSGEPVRSSNSEDVSDNCADFSEAANARLLQSVCPEESTGDSVLVYVYPTWVAPNKLLDHLTLLKTMLLPYGFDSVVALGAIVAESQPNFLLDMLQKFVSGVSLGGTLPPLQLSLMEALEFALYYIGVSGQ